MRRRIDMEPGPMFRGAELPRLMTMLLMLAVIVMLMARARDPKMWTIFGGEEKLQGLAGDPDVPPPEYEQPPSAEHAESSRNSPAESPSSTQSPSVTSVPDQLGPDAQIALPELPAMDEDPEEREALEEEFQVVVDKEFFQKEEMAAYYRLLKWVMSQPLKELTRKAEKDVRYGEIYTRPDHYRGKLLDFRLHVRRVLKHKDIEKENPAGVTKLWELLGYNDSSGSNLYMCVTPELPSKMPVGEKVVEDGRFIGYFLKLVAIEDGTGKNRAYPVFIGRFIWDTPMLQKADPKSQEREIMWGLLAAAIVGLVLFIRWGLQQMKPPRTRSTDADTSLQMMRRKWSLEKNSGEENIDIEGWLDQAESEDPDTAINPPDDDEFDRDDRDSLR